MNENKNQKPFYIYEIVDIDTGEIYKKINNKEFRTIKNETIEEFKKGYKVITNRRIVKHNGQQTINFGK